jgi:hypothetical protein
MADDRRVMYDGFNKKSGHSAEWVSDGARLTELATRDVELMEEE